MRAQSHAPAPHVNSSNELKRDAETNCYLLAGLDTTEIDCCGTATSVLCLWTDGRRRLSTVPGCHRRAGRPRQASTRHGCCCSTRPGCYSCYCEAGIRSCADSNTGDHHRLHRHLLLHCRPVCTRADCCCIRRDPGSRLGPFRCSSWSFGISESIELTFCTKKAPHG